MADHWTEDDLILYFYGEGRSRVEIEQHLQTCASCAASYREIAGTLSLVATPATPERGDQYGLEVWQRVRPELSDRQMPWWVLWMQGPRLAMLATAAVLALAAFVAGRMWEHQPAQTAAVATTATVVPESAGARRRIRLPSVA